MSEQNIPVITDDAALDDFLTMPRKELIDFFTRLDGDVMIVGVAGKMGLTLSVLAVRAATASGRTKKVYGVARFSDPDSRLWLEERGVTTIACDLLEPKELKKLPQVKNIIFMAGRKFGTGGSEDLTWAMNTLVPAYVADYFCSSRIVVFSTGCVYPLVTLQTGGCKENIAPQPLGEYAQSCLGRERLFGYFCNRNQTPIFIYRLNYANDLRYGVLYDIASRVWSGQPVDISVPYLNAIWQGDANYYALMALGQCSVPATVMNITGPETVSTRYVAESFGRLFNKEVRFDGEPGEVSYLSNSDACFRAFGHPSVSLETILHLQAQWLRAGGRGLGKPTHFEVNNGKY